MPNGAFNRAFEEIQLHEFSQITGRWEPSFVSHAQVNLCKEFKGDISAGIWNSTALFCLDPVKAVQRMKYACELAYKVDVLVILEAHGQSGSDSVLREHVRKTHQVYYFPGTAQAAGGVVVCLRNRLISLCGRPVADVLDIGRIICLTCTSGDERLGILAVHIDPHYTVEKKKVLFKKMAAEMRKTRDMLWLVCGDFNFEALGDKSYNAKRCSFMESAVSEQLGLAWNATLGDLVEHHQPEFTRAQNGPHGATLSRLDRIYSNLPAWRMLSAEVRTTTVGHVTDGDRLSDHIPVLTQVFNAERQGIRPLPVWATKDPFFGIALDRELSRYDHQNLTPSGALRQAKDCMRVACRLVARKSLQRGAKTIEEKIYWSLTCARAVFHGVAGLVVRAILAYPALEDFILVGVASGVMVVLNHEGLNEHIAGLMQQSLQRLCFDNEQVKDLPEYQAHKKRCATQRLIDCWATRNRKASLRGARDEAGNVICDPDQAATMLTSHWAQVASEKIIDKRAARKFLREHMRRIPSFRTVLTFIEFKCIIQELPDSACGPDGIPYSAWRHASVQAVLILYRMYCSLFTDENIADDFNYSWLVLLAKGEHDDDDDLVARAPDDTRPVSLANSDSKICELALNKPLAESLTSWGSLEQRGFLADRMMVDNVIELDTYGRIASLSVDSRRELPRKTNLPVMAFFDFAAAFPSVAWMYLWMCMQYCGLPRAYIKAFQKMYANNVHFLRFMGRVYRAYVNASGVKTGGTASGTLFVLCIDPFLHLLRSRMGPRDLMRAFADDIGCVIFNLGVTLPAFAECFKLFGKISNIRLKIKKTIIVPLWKAELDEAMCIIVECVPDWSGVKVAFRAKYLGIQLGPCSADAVWTEALGRYYSRVQMARATGAGLLCSVLEYNIMCVTTLSYVAQFHAVTPVVLGMEARMLQRLAGCPRYTFSTQALLSLDLLGMSRGFASIRASSTAAMIRMATQTATVYAAMKSKYDAALDGDEAFLHNLVCKEVKGFDTPAIVNTLQQAIDTAFLPDVHTTAWNLWFRSLRSKDLEGASWQGLVSKYIDKVTCHFDACAFLSKRMARWRNLVSDEAATWWDYCGPWMLRFCTHEIVGAPDCVLATLLKTVLNGWTTARRFKMQPTRCMFGCGSRRDCIEHYLKCCKVEELWNRLMPFDWGQCEDRLVVGSAHVEGRVVRAYFLYGLYGAYNAIKHASLSNDPIETVAKAMQSRITYALGNSSMGIRQRYSEAMGRPSARRTLRHCITDGCIGDTFFNFKKRARVIAEVGVKRTKTTRTATKRVRVE